MTTDVRVVSTLPSATELIFKLGLGDQLLGVSHECNYPEEATSKPAVTQVNFNYAGASSLEIDRHVSESLHQHRSLYTLDEPLMRRLRPTHLITQQLCEVCAITPNEIQAAIRDLPVAPQIISVAPKSLSDIITDIERIGAALGRQQ